MGYLSCFVYFSHDSYNIADIMTSVPSSAYINAKNAIYISATVYGIGMYIRTIMREVGNATDDDLYNTFHNCYDYTENKYSKLITSYWGIPRESF